MDSQTYEIIVAELKQREVNTVIADILIGLCKQEFKDGQVGSNRFDAQSSRDIDISHVGVTSEVCSKADSVAVLKDVEGLLADGSAIDEEDLSTEKSAEQNLNMLNSMFG